MSREGRQKLLTARLRTIAELSNLTDVEISAIFDFLALEWQERLARAEAAAFIAKSDAKGAL